MTLVLAHRGATGRSAGNTLAAFEAARRMGCDGIEFDVRALGDGTLVVHHDPWVRVRGRRRPFADLDLEGLRALGPRGRAVPTLQETLAWATGSRLLLDVEVKEAGAVAACVEGLRRARGLRFVVTSFEPGVVRAVRAAEPSWQVGWISDEARDDLGRRAHRLGADLLVLKRSVATASRIADARGRSLGVWVWGVDPAPEARRLAARGVEAFITDAAPALRAVFR